VFGSHDRLEKKLREHGRSASATVLEAEQTHWAVARAPDNVVANTQIVWKLKLQVTPSGETPFEAEIEQSSPQLSPPRVGQVVPVLYDPEDHSKVAVDRSDAAQGQAAAEMVESHLSAEQAASIQQFTGSSISELMSAAMADPSGFAAQMQERAAAAQKAAMAQVAAMQAQAAAGQQPAAAQQAGAPPAATSGEALVDALTKLADLRDRGVLTDEEFRAQKKRLLAE
jgi:hypothetical protein